MRLFYKMLSWYHKYQTICWVSSMVTGFAVPAAGYCLYALEFFHVNRTMSADNPELVSERVFPNPLQFLTTDMAGVAGLIMRILLIIGIVLLLLLLVMQVFRMISSQEKKEEETTETPMEEEETPEDPDVDDEEYFDDDDIDDYGEAEEE